MYKRSPNVLKIMTRTSKLLQFFKQIILLKKQEMHNLRFSLCYTIGKQYM